MKPSKTWQWLGIALGLILAAYLLYSRLDYFGDISFLGAVLLLEILIACLWKYNERFFVLLVIMFLWAGVGVPLQRAGFIGRWFVLGAGALVGFIIWTRGARRPFQSIHLIAFFCGCAAFVSATVSSYVQMASFKALSLSLLFLYCVSGARLAVLDRERRFFNGLILGTELTVYLTALCYFGLGDNIWGNPNSLGAAMSIGVFPILFWAWLTADGPTLKVRRLLALLLCTYLIRFSLERAGLITAAFVAAVLCVSLHQYKLLVKVTALVLLAVSIGGVLAPQSLHDQIVDLKDALLYKGHKEEGMLGSRRSPWDQSIATIKEHPFFGTGYGTSPTGEDPGLLFGTYYSTSETVREHGSSYMTIAEWVGLMGVLPFVALLAVTVSNVWRVCAWMRRNADPTHYSIPLAMVTLAGLVHAGFEDWLFAVGSYLSVYFWVLAFVLADLVPEGVAVPETRALAPVPRPFSVGFAPAAPHPAVSNSALCNR